MRAELPSAAHATRVKWPSASGHDFVDVNRSSVKQSLDCIWSRVNSSRYRSVAGARIHRARRRAVVLILRACARERHTKECGEAPVKAMGNRHHNFVPMITDPSALRFMLPL